MEETPIRAWVNNPTVPEAQAGVRMGVYGATTNPTFPMKMLKHAEFGEQYHDFLKTMLDKYGSEGTDGVIKHFYMENVAVIAKEMYGAFKDSDGVKGLVYVIKNKMEDYYEKTYCSITRNGSHVLLRCMR